MTQPVPVSRTHTAGFFSPRAKQYIPLGDPQLSITIDHILDRADTKMGHSDSAHSNQRQVEAAAGPTDTDSLVANAAVRQQIRASTHRGGGWSHLQTKVRESSTRLQQVKRGAHMLADVADDMRGVPFLPAADTPAPLVRAAEEAAKPVGRRDEALASTTLVTYPAPTADMDYLLCPRPAASSPRAKSSRVKGPRRVSTAPPRAAPGSSLRVPDHLQGAPVLLDTVRGQLRTVDQSRRPVPIQPVRPAASNVRRKERRQHHTAVRDTTTVLATTVPPEHLRGDFLRLQGCLAHGLEKKLVEYETARLHKSRKTFAALGHVTDMDARRGLRRIRATVDHSVATRRFDLERGRMEWVAVVEAMLRENGRPVTRAERDFLRRIELVYTGENQLDRRLFFRLVASLPRPELDDIQVQKAIHYMVTDVLPGQVTLDEYVKWLDFNALPRPAALMNSILQRRVVGRGKASPARTGTMTAKGSG